MSSRPPIDVIEKFNASPEIDSLDGGEGRCWRAGEVILKPCDDPAMWQWLAEYLPTVKPDGFRLPLPIVSSDGGWVVNGWCAQKAVAGEHPKDGRWDERWAEVLHTVDLFHKAVKHLPRAESSISRTSLYALGDRVAWEEEKLSNAFEPLPYLFDLRRPVMDVSQFVHGDLSENVLFAEGHLPAVIDISPYWRPVGFAFGIVVADAVCWRGANPTELLKHVAHVDQFPQFLIRALIFRMVITIAFSKGKPDLSGYSPCIDMIAKLTS